MLDVLKIPPGELLALLVAIGFAAGLNLYATVAVLGLLGALAIFLYRKDCNCSKAGP